MFLIIEEEWRNSNASRVQLKSICDNGMYVLSFSIYFLYLIRMFEIVHWISLKYACIKNLKNTIYISVSVPWNATSKILERRNLYLCCAWPADMSSWHDRWPDSSTNKQTRHFGALGRCEVFLINRDAGMPGFSFSFRYFYENACWGNKNVQGRGNAEEWPLAFPSSFSRFRRTNGWRLAADRELQRNDRIPS